MFSPLEVFSPLSCLSVSSSVLTLVLTLSLLGLVYAFSPWGPSLNLYSFILTLSPQGVSYPFLSCLFLLVSLANTVGLAPYTFTWTALFSTTLTLSVSLWIGCLISSIYSQGNSFLSHFLPEGVPLGLALLLIPIEMISYLASAFSLGVSLAANIISGHLLLAVLMGFVTSLGAWGFLLLVLISILSLLEIAVCLIQAYVFVTLTGIYLGEA